MFRKLGDEIDCLNDSWMFLLWSSDTSPVLSHSPSSRWPICIVPASRYVYENGVNITIQSLTHAIANSFNRLSNFGIPVRDLASLGGGLVPLMSIGAIYFLLNIFKLVPVNKMFVHGIACVCVTRLGACGYMCWATEVTGKRLLLSLT